jgi:hypothetical protein
MIRLMAPDAKLLKQRINKLVDDNNRLYGVDNNGFTVMNYYIERGGKITEMLIWEPSCHNSLKNEAINVVRHWKEMKDDDSYLVLVLRELVAPCKSEQEVRDALPECLVQLVPSLSCLPRTKEAGYTLKSDSAINLESALGRFHTYAAMHMMV